MKPTPKHDFPITVRPASWEVPESDAKLYDGIFNVILNFTINVAFVPYFGRGFGDWPPVLPEEMGVFDQRMARLECVEEARYVVTPDELRAGTQEQITIRDSNEDIPDVKQINIFYVEDKQFELFTSELVPLPEDIGGIHTSMPLSQLKQYYFTRFIVEAIVSSPLFKDRDRALLGR